MEMEETVEEEKETPQKNQNSPPSDETKMPLTMRDFRVMMFYDFSNGLTARDCCRKLTRIFKEEAPKKTMIFKWYQRFSSGHFDFDDEKRTPKPRSSTDTVNVYRVKKMLIEDESVSIRKAAEELGLSRYAVETIIERDLGVSKIPMLRYSFEEDMAILKFLTTEKRYLKSAGLAVWKEAERMQVCPGRPHQSMKERYKKVIVRNIKKYNLDKDMEMRITQFERANVKGKQAIRDKETASS